jgi:hypothetical protein
MPHFSAQQPYGEQLLAAKEFGRRVESMNHAMFSAIVFSAIAAESFIFNAASTSLSKGFAKDFLDKLDTVAKWIVIPRLINGFEFPRDTLPFAQLKNLVAARNRLVHYKSKTVPFDDSAFELIAQDSRRFMLDAENAIACLDSLAELASRFCSAEDADSLRESLES